MGTSSITITTLIATPTLRGNKLVATVSATGPAANIPTLMLANVEFWSSTTDDFTTATKVGEGNPELFHAGLLEEQTYYYWAKPRAVNGSYGAVYPVSPTAGVACTAIGMSGLAFGLANGRLVTSVAANALTIAVKTAAGNDPSASDKSYVAFSTSVGGYQIRSIDAPVSLTINSGATLGVTANIPFCLWLQLIDVGDGTVALAIEKCSVWSTNAIATIYPLLDGEPVDTTAIDANADSSGVMYATSTMSQKSMRVLARLDFDSGLATPGTWISQSRIAMVGPHTKLPGDVVQQAGAMTDAYVTSYAGVIPADDTVPQIGEGSQIFSQNIKPTNPANFIHNSYRFDLIQAVAGADLIAASLFENSNADAVYTATKLTNAISKPERLQGDHWRQAGSRNTITFSVRIGGEGPSSTIFLNGYTGASLYYGGRQESSHIVREIQA